MVLLICDAGVVLDCFLIKCRYGVDIADKSTPVKSFRNLSDIFLLGVNSRFG